MRRSEVVQYDFFSENSPTRKADLFLNWDGVLQEYALDENIELEDEYFEYGEDVMWRSLLLNTQVKIQLWSQLEFKTWETFPDAIARGAWNLNLEKRDFSSIYVLPALIVLSVKI